MSRTYRLGGHDSTDLPAQLELDLLKSLGYPEATAFLVHRAPSIYWRFSSTLWLDAGVVSAELRRRGWPEHAVRAFVARYGRWLRSEPSSFDLRLSRRLYRRRARQAIAAGRYDELDPYPHRAGSWWFD